MALKQTEMHLLKVRVRLNTGIHAHLDQQSEPLLVTAWAAVVSWKLPGQVQPVEVMGAEVSDGRLDEGCAALWPGNHADEPGGMYKKKISIQSTSIVVIQRQRERSDL